jgi:hypothetical protein
VRRHAFSPEAGVRVRTRVTVRGSRARLRARTDETALSRYYSDYQRSDRTPQVFIARHPVASLLAVVAVIRLPRTVARLSCRSAGEVIHRALSRPILFGAPMGVTGVAALLIPEDPHAYVRGRNRQTLRRKLRSAQRRGIMCRVIDDPTERRTLLSLADETEMSHPNARYRTEHPDNTDLLDHDLWLGAFSAEGAPLLLSVTPTDGNWGLLRYFRTLGHGPEHSDSRYAMYEALVRSLSARGVRYLLDTWHPGEIPEGLRHFQRMVGFRIMRVVPRPVRCPAAPCAQAAERVLTGVVDLERCSGTR